MIFESFFTNCYQDSVLVYKFDTSLNLKLSEEEFVGGAEILNIDWFLLFPSIFFPSFLLKPYLDNRIVFPIIEFENMALPLCSRYSLSQISDAKIGFVLCLNAKRLLNFNCLTMKFHNRNHANMTTQMVAVLSTCTL